MGAPVGNKHAAKGREWADQLRWALENFTATGIARGQALRAIATKVVEQALDGDKDARAEIANRLDGKPHQSMDIGINDNRSAEELSDNELAAIATTGSPGASVSKGGKAKPGSVH